MRHLTTIDLGFQGFSQIIAAYAAPTGDGRFVLFESGPASSVEAIESSVTELGFAMEDLAAIFATHIHLDHSGGAGVLARRTGCTVYAHPAGVAHLIDPSAKLLPSAERLYGEMLEPLWGRTEGVPSRQLKAVGHGEKIGIGELEVTAWHTPAMLFITLPGRSGGMWSPAMSVESAFRAPITSCRPCRHRISMSRNGGRVSRSCVRCRPSGCC